MTTTTKTCRDKLSVRKDTIFKKPSSSCSSSSTSSSSLYKKRETTVLKKAYELSELCGVDVCIICYDSEGNLVKTWPEEEAKVRVMAERFSRLNEQERNKKSTNLSRFLNKKMIDEKKASFTTKDNRFSQKVLEIEESLESRVGIFQEKLQRLLLLPGQDHQTVVSTNLSSNPSSLINVDHPSTSESPADLSMTSLKHPSNFSILLYNHDNGTFTQLADSATPIFEQPEIPCNQDYGTNYLDLLLLGEQGIENYNNFDLPLSTIPPPLMQTQPQLFQQFDHQFMQTQPAVPYNHIPYCGNPTLMFS